MARSVHFVGGLVVVAVTGLIVWLSVAPSPAPATAPVPAVQTVTVEPAACTQARAEADTLARDITRVIHVGRIRVRTFSVLVRRYRADAASCEATS